MVEDHFQLPKKMNSIMRSAIVVLVAMIFVGQAQGKLIIASWFSSHIVQ